MLVLGTKREIDKSQEKAIREVFYRVNDHEFWTVEDLLAEVNEWGPSALDLVEGGTIYEAYLKIEHPWTFDAKGANWDAVPWDDGTWSTRELDRMAKALNTLKLNTPGHACDGTVKLAVDKISNPSKSQSKGYRNHG